MAGTLGWPVDGSVADGRRQAGSGIACSRARARLNCSSQGQRRGRCRVNRRAERVSRPARAKNRRRRVLVVTICSPRPSRAVQRARLCAACGEYNAGLGREPSWSCPGCSTVHDRNHNAARNLLKLALLAVGEDVTLLDRKALASGTTAAAETGLAEGRTKPGTAVYTQLKLAA